MYLFLIVNHDFVDASFQRAPSSSTKEKMISSGHLRPPSGQNQRSASRNSINTSLVDSESATAASTPTAAAQNGHSGSQANVAFSYPDRPRTSDGTTRSSSRGLLANTNNETFVIAGHTGKTPYNNAAAEALAQQRLRDQQLTEQTQVVGHAPTARRVHSAFPSSNGASSGSSRQSGKQQMVSTSVQLPTGRFSNGQSGGYDQQHVPLQLSSGQTSFGSLVTGQPHMSNVHGEETPTSSSTSSKKITAVRVRKGSFDKSGALIGSNSSLREAWGNSTNGITNLSDSTPLTTPRKNRSDASSVQQGSLKSAMKNTSATNSSAMPAIGSASNARPRSGAGSNMAQKLASVSAAYGTTTSASVKKRLAAS